MQPEVPEGQPKGPCAARPVKELRILVLWDLVTWEGYPQPTGPIPFCFWFGALDQGLRPDRFLINYLTVTFRPA